MKTIIILFLALTVATFAKPKEFTILGGQKIKAEVENGMPKGAEGSGIAVKAAAFMIGEGKLIFTFGFTAPDDLQRVTIEDVSGKEAVVLVDDQKPKLNNMYWMGNATPLPLSKAGVPWVFERGDTTKVFRITANLASRPEPVVLFQPAIYPSATKKQLQQLAK